LNFLVIFMIGIKYCGALHLWFCVSNVSLQILCGSAALLKGLNRDNFLIHFYKYFAFLLL